jgi:hypothetical protein
VGKSRGGFETRPYERKCAKYAKGKVESELDGKVSFQGVTANVFIGSSSEPVWISA